MPSITGKDIPIANQAYGCSPMMLVLPDIKTFNQIMAKNPEKIDWEEVMKIKEEHR